SSGEFSRRLLGFVFDALAAWNVLSFRRLPRLGGDEEPDCCRDHLFLRDHAVILSRADSIHSARRQLRNARRARLFLRDRAYGHIFARHHRHETSCSLSEHDRAAAGIDLSSVSIAQVEVVTDGSSYNEAKKN